MPAVEAEAGEEGAGAEALLEEGVGAGAEALVEGAGAGEEALVEEVGAGAAAAAPANPTGDGDRKTCLRRSVECSRLMRGLRVRRGRGPPGR